MLRDQVDGEVTLQWRPSDASMVASSTFRGPVVDPLRFFSTEKGYGVLHTLVAACSGNLDVLSDDSISLRIAYLVRKMGLEVLDSAEQDLEKSVSFGDERTGEFLVQVDSDATKRYQFSLPLRSKARSGESTIAAGKRALGYVTGAGETSSIAGDLVTHSRDRHQIALSASPITPEGFLLPGIERLLNTDVEQVLKASIRAAVSRNESSSTFCVKSLISGHRETLPMSPCHVRFPSFPARLRQLPDGLIRKLRLNLQASLEAAEGAYLNVQIIPVDVRSSSDYIRFIRGVSKKELLGSSDFLSYACPPEHIGRRVQLHLSARDTRGNDLGSWQTKQYTLQSDHLPPTARLLRKLFKHLRGFEYHAVELRFRLALID